MGRKSEAAAAGRSLECTIQPPKDSFNVAYIIYFVLGTGFLLPWNAFMTAVDYFHYLYPTTHVDRLFSSVYVFACFRFLLLLMFCGLGFSSRMRINCGLCLLMAMVSLVPIMDELVMKKEEDSRGSWVSYCVTVGGVAGTGVGNGIVQGSLVGAAGELPERYMQALVGGTAASGVLVSILRIFTKAALPRTPAGLRKSSNLFFLVSAIFLVLCIFLHNIVHKLPVIQFYNTLNASISESTPLLKDEKSTIFKNSYVTKSVEYWQTFKHIQGLVFSLAFIYVVTASIFPGFITENVHSIELGDWYPILLITTFNASDLLGKMLTALYIIRSKAMVKGMCLARTQFLPLFAGCLIGPAFMHSEAVVFLLTFLLGVTSGYLSSVIMISAPKMVALQNAEVAGIIVGVFLSTGIAAGSFLGWVWIM